MKVVFQGLESPSHRVTLKSLLSSHGFTDVYAGVSFKTLRSRRLSEKYVRELAADVPVVMDAGVSQSPLTQEEADEFAKDYYSFVLGLSEAAHIVEFEHASSSEVARSLVASARDVDERIIPTWNPDEGIPTLQDLISQHARVGMGADTLEDKRVPAVLRGTRQDSSIHLAMGTSRLDHLQHAGITMVSTSAWLAAASFGEFIFFDGSKMHRATSAERPVLMKRHIEQIEAAGFDPDKVLADDQRELTRLAGYSFLAWAKHLSAKRPVSGGESVATGSEEPDSSTALAVKPKREAKMLPIFGTDSSVSVETDEDGQSEIRERPILTTRPDTVRQCDSCFLAGVCPAFEPNNSCAYNFPVEVRTHAQMRALLHSILELQASRVAFGKFAEDVNGGYPDDAVSKEMDRLFRMAESLKKVEERRERLTVSVEHEESGGSGGVLSAIFGKAMPQAPAIEADTVIAEVVEE